MEALKTSETLIDEGLVKSKQDRVGNLVDGMFPEVSRSLDLGTFDLGNGKCVENLSVPVLESSGIDSCSNVKRFDPLSHPMSSFVGTGSVIGSSSQGDVSMKGISLFVQLTGGMASKVDGVEHVGNANDRVLHRDEVKDNVDDSQEEFKVSVGDFVWALLKKQRDSWWPGIVCDASSAPKEVMNRPTSEDEVLVRCFGSGKYIWCLAYNVKPFVGYFEGIPSQSKARRFIDAYEKAVAEFGHRVKTEFTCSCFSETKVEKLGNIGELSVSEFEPATFVDNIKDLARDISMPNKIDYVVKQNCLSAFYRSLGHCQIPMHQLKPANGTPTKIKIEEENGGVLNEIRDRRKSKFLAYPGEYGTEESKVDINGEVDLNQTDRQPVKKPGKKRGRKRKEVTVCTSDVLSQLRVAAQDCLFQCASKNFDSVKSFISGFRKHAFKDISSEIPMEMPNHQILQETIPKKVRKKKDKSIVPPTLGNNLNHASLILDFQNVLSLNGEAQSNANKSTEEVTGQSPFFSFGYQPTIRAPPCKLKPIKRKKNVSLNGEVQSNANMSMEEVTGQSPFFSFGDQPATGAPPCKLKPIKRKKNVPLNGEALSNANKSTQEVTGQSPFFSFGDQPATGAPPYNLMPIKREENVSLNGEAQSNANKSMEEVTGQIPVFSFGHQPMTGAPPCKLKPIKRKKNAESNTSMPTWNYNVSPLPNVNGNVDPFLFQDDSDPPNANGHVNPFPFHNVSALPNVNGHVNPFPFHVIPYVPDIPQRNDVEGLDQSQTSHFTDQAGSTPSFFTGNHGEPQLALVPTGLIHEPKKRGRKRKNIYLQANPGSTIIPHLNENGPEANNVKRVKKSKEIGVACIDLSYTKVRQDIEEVTGTAFLLKFSPEHPLPSSQDLNSVFSKYGALVESETQVLNESLSGQVVFLESSSAGEAFWRLQNDQPFGPALVNYRIQHLAGAAESVVNFKTPIKSTSGFKPMDQQAVPGSTQMPDLNGNSNEVKLVKISKTIEEIRLPPKENLISSEAHQGNNGEVTGNTALLLKFSPDHPLPSPQDLNSVFCKYGELREFETRVSGENLTGEVVFVNPSFAGHAVQCLEKDRPFWPALVSYQVHHLYSVPSAIQVKPPINTPLALKPPQNGEPPDLAAIKRNLEMMNSMLEKAGNTLSPEMRGKLESEIKGLMNKVSAMDGSSSSCL